jgi:hypothetical protein
MPADARLSASETKQFNLREQIHALKTQQGATLKYMAYALRTFQERTTIVDTFQSLFPQHARRAIQKALTSTPAAIHEHMLETFMTLVSTHHFPVEEWDVEQVLDQFPMIPICALNYDEESELDGEYLATRIAATMTGYYSSAPSWEEIQQALGPTIQVPTCFTDPHHQCRVNLGILTERCQQLRRPVSDFPTILRIMHHDTGTLFLDISYAYEAPDHGYTWTKQDIQDLTDQWKRAKQLTGTWIRTAKRLDAQPRHWQTIFSCWQQMCEHDTRTDQ